MEELKDRVNTAGPGVHVLAVKGDPKSLLERAQEELDALRAPLLQPFKINFSAPNRVGLYLFQDGSWVVENFSDEEASVDLAGEAFKVPGRGWTCRWRQEAPAVQR